MTKICKQCGESFTPARAYYVVCFDCYVASIRKAQTDRAALCVPRVSIARSSIARYNASMTSKQNTSNGNKAERGGDEL